MPRMAADSSIMGQCGCTAYGVSMIQGHKSLTLIFMIGQ